MKQVASTLNFTFNGYFNLQRNLLTFSYIDLTLFGNIWSRSVRYFWMVIRSWALFISRLDPLKISLSFWIRQLELKWTWIIWKQSENFTNGITLVAMIYLLSIKMSLVAFCCHIFTHLKCSLSLNHEIFIIFSILFPLLNNKTKKCKKKRTRKMTEKTIVITVSKLQCTCILINVNLYLFVSLYSNNWTFD